MIRFHFLTICAAAFSVSMVACGPAEPEQPTSQILSQAEAEAMVKELADAHAAASTSGDTDALVNHYAENAIRFKPNRPARIGAEAIRAAFQNEAEQFELDITNRVEKVLVSEDWIFQQGSWSGTVTEKDTPEATPREDKGYWMALLQRQPDGSWKTFRDMWVSELPVAQE